MACIDCRRNRDRAQPMAKPPVVTAEMIAAKRVRHQRVMELMASGYNQQEIHAKLEDEGFSVTGRGVRDDVRAVKAQLTDLASEDPEQASGRLLVEITRVKERAQKATTPVEVSACSVELRSIEFEAKLLGVTASGSGNRAKRPVRSVEAIDYCLDSNCDHDHKGEEPQ